MSDKTCYTCLHCTERHGKKNNLADHVCLYIGTLISDCGEMNCGGTHYEDRLTGVNLCKSCAYFTDCPDETKRLDGVCIFMVTGVLFGMGCNCHGVHWRRMGER